MESKKMVMETAEDRRDFMEKSKVIGEGYFFGENQNGEAITISVYDDGMTITTNQKNHHVRENYYNSEGFSEGESFNGRWE